MEVYCSKCMLWAERVFTISWSWRWTNWLCSFQYAVFYRNKRVNKMWQRHNSFKMRYFQCPCTLLPVRLATRIFKLQRSFREIFQEMLIHNSVPNVNYSWRTAPLTYKIAFYIFVQQIQVPNILNMVYTLRFLLFKMQFDS